jgi:predicted permease
MGELLSDFRYSLRMLVKRPGTSIIAIVAFALGIGLTTTMFSIVEGVIFRGLPFDESDRILLVSRATTKEPARLDNAPPQDLADWRGQQKSFESLAGYFDSGGTLSNDGNYPDNVRGLKMTPNTLSVLRVRPIIGRDFSDTDAAPGAQPVVLIGYALWQSRFSGNRDISGTVVRINGTPTTIVGVMPEKFGFPEAAQIWQPADATPPVQRDKGTRLRVIGRLRSGVTLAAAQAEMAGIGRQLASTYPENKDLIVNVGRLIDASIPLRIRTTFYTMLIAVLGVMLIACVNVTNLQVARAAERAKEFAVRSALGSGKWRIVRQSLAEGLVLAGLGAAIGLAIAQVGVVYFMQAIADTQPPFWIDVKLDPTVLAFVTAITALAAIISSVGPGLGVARSDTNAILKDDTRGTTSLRMGRFGRWLVIVEVFVSCTLLVVSGLTIRSILITNRLDYPFATRDVFFANTTFEQRIHPDMPAVVRAMDLLEAGLAQLPGVRRVALANSVPGSGPTPSFSLEGETYASPEAQPRAQRIVATAGYFETLGIPLRQGRLFTAADNAGADPIAVVDEAFVARHLVGGAVLGRRIRFGDDKSPWLTIVGVVQSVVVAQRPDQIVESVYLPFAQLPQRSFAIFARAGGDPAALTSGVRGALATVSPETSLNSPNSLAGELWRQGWAYRLFGGLFLAFGVAALVLAAAGLYGVMAFTVRRRTHEIAVRMALGASRRRMLGTVLWQGCWRVALGVALGLVPGWYLGTFMRALLANVSPTDPVVFVTTAVTLLASGAVASLVPAMRASSVDPLTSLRTD